MLVRQLSTPVNAIFLDVSIDYRVLTFTAIVTMLTALLFGTSPAFRAATVEPIRALKERGRATAQRGHGRFGEWLIAVQVALSLVLVVAAALFVRSFTSLTTRPLGFDPERVVVVTMNAPQATEPSARVPLYARVSDEVRNLPDVAAAALSYLTPAGGGGFTPAVAVTSTDSVGQVEANRDVFGNLISAEWFSTYRTRIVAGRDFAPSDRAGAPLVTIVNETFARRFFPNRSPMGETLTVYPGTPRARAMQIVGVSADAVYPTPRDPITPTWFAPIAQFDGFSFAAARLTVRARTTAQDVLTKQVAGAIASVDPALTAAFRPLEDQLRGSLLQQRILARLAGIFGGLALVLAGIGLYGITSDATLRRRSEIGVRIALGARPTGVIVTVLTRASVMGAAGAAGGLVVSLWASKFVSALLPGVAPRDPITLAAAILVLLAVLALACWIPARRASRLDPVVVLRAE
jgi:predicted permease